MVEIVVFSAVLARHAIDPVGVITIVLGLVVGLYRAWPPWALAMGLAIGFGVLLMANARRNELGLGPSPSAGSILTAYAMLVLFGYGLGRLFARFRKTQVE